MVETDLPTCIPLEEAAEQYHISPEDLIRAIKNSFVRAVQLNSYIAVAGEDVKALIEKNIENALPAFTPLTEAAERYEVPVEALIQAVEGDILQAVRIGEIVAVSNEDVITLSNRSSLPIGLKIGRFVATAQVRA